MLEFDLSNTDDQRGIALEEIDEQDKDPVQFAIESTDPDLDDMIALGTSESVKRIRAAKSSLRGIVKKKA